LAPTCRRVASGKSFDKPAAHEETPRRWANVAAYGGFLNDRRLRTVVVRFVRFHQFFEAGAKVPERTDVVPSNRWPVVAGCRHVLDPLVQVFNKGQSPNVRGGVGVLD